MDDNIVVCLNCGAKLRLKPAAMKVMKSVRCGKCRKNISLSPEETQPEPGPAATPAPSSGTPQAPAPAPEPAPSPVPASSPKPPASATEKKAPAPAPAPVPHSAPSSPAASPTQPAPTHSASDMEKRVKELESTVSKIQDVVKTLCRLETDAARIRIEELQKSGGKL